MSSKKLEIREALDDYTTDKFQEKLFDSVAIFLYLYNSLCQGLEFNFATNSA